MRDEHTNAREAYTDQLSPTSKVITVLNRTTTREKGNTQNETPRGKNHNGTPNKNNNRTTALQRPQYNFVYSQHRQQ